MSKIEEMEIITHPNFYSNQDARKIPIKIAVPSDGVNNETILLVLSYGYSGSYKSNIFNKLMQQLPDKYNMAVVSGAYFGCEFMGMGKIEIDLDNVGDIILRSQNNCYEVSFADENENNFNDMGIMQALDNIYITFAALEHMGMKSHECNHVISFGSSHGGYISHLANLLCPNLYTYVLDVSGYTFPYYINRVRELEHISAYLKLHYGWNYFVNIDKRYQVKYDLLNLKHLYRSINNSCRIIAFQGTEDWMVDYREKQILMDIIGGKADYMLFTPADIDGKFIKNADHGLDMDFMLLFAMIIPMISQSTSERTEIHKDDLVLGYGDLILDYSSGLPLIKKIVMEDGTVRQWDL